MTLASFFVVLVVSLAASIGLTALTRRLAISRNLVARPKEDRWHKRPVALMGGAAIFASFIIGVGAARAGGLMASLDYRDLMVLMACTLMFLLGFIDDLKSLNPQTKLSIQIILAGVLVSAGIRAEWFESLTLNVLVSFVWLVGLTNALNLLDNMDGLAAGVGIISSVFLLLAIGFTGANGPAGSSWFIAALIGSLVGFLVFNFNPASIFMGDSGSLFIGFLLGAVSIGGSLGKPGNVVSVVAIPALILVVPILDTAFVTVMRKVFLRPVSRGGTDHSSHRLVALGFSERRAVIILYFFSAAGGSLALAHYYLSFHTFFTLILLFVIIVGLLWLYLAKVRVYPEEEKPLVYKNENLTPLWVEITYRRRLFEVMLDFVLISAAYYISYLLRFEGPEYAANFKIFLKSLPIVIAAKYACFSIMGVYRGFWRYTGIPELVTYMKAVTLGSVLSVLLILLAYRFISFSRAVFIIDWFLLFVFVAGTRLSFRIIGESAKRSVAREGLPIIIYGAGDKGELTLREILNNPNLPLSPVGFVDDDPRKQEKRIRGYPVLGDYEALASLIKEHGAKEVILAVTGMEREREAGVEEICRAMGVTLKKTYFYIR